MVLLMSDARDPILDLPKASGIEAKAEDGAKRIEARAEAGDEKPGRKRIGAGRGTVFRIPST